MIASIIVIVGYKSNDKEELLSSNRSTSNTSTSEDKVELTKKEYASLVGKWECIDPDWTGDKVYLSKYGDGLSIQYDGEEKINVELTSESEEEDYVYYRLENKKI